MTVKEQNQLWDCVVIGGGLSGLVASTILSENNMKVLLLESSHALGGRARTNEINGNYLNWGPHALYKKGEGLKILRDINLNINGGNVQQKGKFLYGQQVFDAPITPFSLLFSRLLTWREKMEYSKWFLKIPRLEIAQFEGMTFEDWNNTNVKSEKIKNLLYLLVRLTTYSNNPELLDARAAINQLKLSLGGTIYVNKGWQTMINDLADKATKSGVLIKKNSPVKKIDTSNNQIQIGLGNGELLVAKYAISTLSPFDLNNVWTQGKSISLEQMIEQCIPVKGASLDLVLKRLPNSKINFAMDMDKPYYYSNHSKSARLTSNLKYQVVHVFKYYSHQIDENYELVRNELENYLDFIQPGWKNEVITSRFLPSMTVSHSLPTPSHQSIMSVVNSSFPHFMLAGEWTNQNGILADSAIVSGKNAALTIIKNDRK